MCGIFGVVSDGTAAAVSKESLLTIVKKLLLLSEIRGKEASGLAALSADSITVLKRPIAASRLVSTSTFKSLLRSTGIDSNQLLQKQVGNAGSFQNIPSTADYHGVAVIGHARLVTNGAREQHLNNQPVASSGIVAIHNGIVINDDELFQSLDLGEREFEVDSEVIPKLIRYYLNQGLSLPRSTQKAFQNIKGQASVGLLFEDFDSAIFATNNGSLYLAQSLTENLIVFASEKFILDSFLKKSSSRLLKGPFRVEQVKPNTAICVDYADFSVNTFSLIESEKQIACGLTKRRHARVLADVSEQVTLTTTNNFSYTNTHQFNVTAFKEFDKFYSSITTKVDQLKRCSKCILPETFPFIHFDAGGVCNYCTNYQPIQTAGPQALEKKLEVFRDSSGKPDCIVSLSGGRDSSYALHYITSVLGLRPITYTYDWGMVTDIARRNISRMCGQLGIEHILVSANIPRKRLNIRRNVSAWLKKPELGLVPLFMAGDKQYFYHGARLMKQFEVEVMVLAENLLERTNFKTGFCGVPPTFESNNTYGMSLGRNLKMVSYYLSHFARNPGYINPSLLDTFAAYCSYYILPHNFLSLFRYLEWDEATVNDTLVNHYDWEVASDTKSTWRIGDGTSPFYNYIYYISSGFTENDTFKSNQIREGVISREEALRISARDNIPRWDSIQWYCDTVGIPFEETIKTINNMPSRLLVKPL